MGNYESHTEGLSVEIEAADDGDLLGAVAKAEAVIKEGLSPSLHKAAEISSVANTYILTWLEDE
jgi:hypothetical protein